MTAENETMTPLGRAALIMNDAALHAHGHVPRYVQQILDALVQGNPEKAAKAIDEAQDALNMLGRTVRDALVIQASERGARVATGADVQGHDRVWCAALAGLMPTNNHNQPYGIDSPWGMRGRAL